MTGKQILIAIASVAAIALIVVALISTWSASNRDAKELESSSSSSLVDSSTSSSSASSEPATDAVQQISAAQFTGLDTTRLTDEQKQQLVEQLGQYFSGTSDITQTTFEITDTGEDVEGYQVYKLKLNPQGESYDLFVGDMIMIYPSASDEGQQQSSTPSKSEPQTTPLESQAKDSISSETFDVSSQNSYGELNSVETDFDTMSSWSLSDTEKMKGMLPDAVIGRLYSDLSGQLSERGVNLETPAQIMVSEKDIAHADGAVTFDILIYHQNDRIIIQCKYLEDGSDYEMRLMP